MSRPAYTRMAHFERWLNVLQAKESQQVPKDIIDEIKAKLNGKDIDVYSIRRILRDLGYYRWIDHARQIDAIIHNVPLPTLTAEETKQAKKNV